MEPCGAGARVEGMNDSVRAILDGVREPGDLPDVVSSGIHLAEGLASMAVGDADAAAESIAKAAAFAERAKRCAPDSSTGAPPAPSAR